MAENKKIISCLGCREGRAVKRDYSREFYEMDIIDLAVSYSDSGADELMIHDLSENEEDHERTVRLIKEITRTADIPVIAGGRVRRLEDVKKYLYAGAKAVFLDVSDPDNVDLMKEASSRFGEEKIYAYLPDFQYTDHTQEYAQLGASVMILDDMDLCDEHLRALSCSEQRFFISCDGAPSTASLFLKVPSVDGAVFIPPGSQIWDFMKVKQQLKARGVPVDTFETSIEWKDFKKNSDGLIPVIVQDYRTMEVLMMAYMDEEAFHETLLSGRMTYFSRSRKKLWMKGETSGHYQYVKSLNLDCDNDTMLARVRQVGAACHTGSRTCFYQSLVEKEHKNTNPLKVFEDVYQVILDRKANPREGSYTNYLFDKGIDKILKKLGEEAVEIVIAAKNPDSEEIVYEISDFLYHVMVLMAEKNVTWEDITEELANR